MQQERFAENDIEMAVFRGLDPSQRFWRLLGHRLKVLRAVRDLGNPWVVAAALSAPAAAELAGTRGLPWVRRDRNTLKTVWLSKVLYG